MTAPRGLFAADSRRPPVAPRTTHTCRPRPDVQGDTMTTTAASHPHPQQRRDDAGPRLRRLPDPARRDDRSRRDRPADRLPAHRHRRGVRQRARGRRGASDASGLDRDEVFVETKVWISDYGYDATLHAFDKSAGKLGARPDRPADPAPGRCRAGSTSPSTPTGRWRPCWPTARSARSASATSCPTTSTRSRRDDLGDPGGQPDRGPPLLPPARRARRRTPSAASSPRPGRRSAASRSTATAARARTLRGPDHRRDRRRPTAGRRPR